MKRLRVRTPAKVNLFLRVLGSRPDGYHDIETIFQAIDIYDELIIDEDYGGPSLEVPGRPDLENPQNLVMRALRRLEHRTSRPLSVRIRLIKTIPVAAGLGGGSSDAAAALSGIAALCNLGLSEDDLRTEAELLGADVPFFLVGGTAVGEGVGERLTPVRLSTDYGLVLARPKFAVSTAAVYREFDRILTRPSPASTVWQRLRDSHNPVDLLENDLEAVTIALHPEVGAVKKALTDVGAATALMTGSGPTVFGISGPDARELEAIRAGVSSHLDPVIARPVPYGATID